MKKIFLFTLLCLWGCSKDDYDDFIPDVWISASAGNVTIFNDTGKSLGVSGWRLVEENESGSSIGFTIQSGTTIIADGSITFDITKTNFTFDCPGYPSIFLFDEKGKEIDGTTCF